MKDAKKTTGAIGNKTVSQKQSKSDYGKAIKLFQIVSVVFMLMMLVCCILLLKKYNVSVKNLGALQKMLTGGMVTVAIGMIVFSVVKSFALVFPPAVLFALSGLFFKNIWIAMLVNLLATVLSLSLPYYMGRFTGKNMLDTLKSRFPKVKKIDDFAEANDSALVFIVKASGILPSDLSSVIFGAMNIPYKKYMLGAIFGLLPLNIMWTLLGTYGDLTNPLSFLYILPIIIFAAVCTILMNKFTKGKKAKIAA